jgi:hypothetical protein
VSEDGDSSEEAEAENSGIEDKVEVDIYKVTLLD